jgi:DNA-binding transcriptional MocR family regulator
MDVKETTDTVHNELAITKPQHHNPTGTVTLLEDGEVVLIPTPSLDPRGE